MTESTLVFTVVRALLLIPRLLTPELDELTLGLDELEEELDVAEAELEEELDVAEAEVLPGLAESPVIPPPQWGYES